MFRVEFGEFCIGSSQVYNHKTNPAFKILPENVIGQKEFAFSRGCEDGKIPGFDALLFIVPNIFQNRNIMFPVIKNYPGFIRFIIAVIDKKAQTMFKIGNVQILIAKIGRETEKTVEEVIFPLLSQGEIGGYIQFFKFGLDPGANFAQVFKIPVPIDHIEMPANDP